MKVIGNKATVMELLWVDFVHDVVLQIPFSEARFQMHIGSEQVAMIPWNDTRVFANYDSVNMGVATAAGSGSVIITFPMRYDFQTNDGFGYLLASDSFRVSMDSSNSGAIAGFAWKLFYRFVDIPLTEFLGIVQSTQAS